MKKITFILVALIAGTTYAQESTTAEVAAEIVSPISITKVTGSSLSFGAIASNSTKAVKVTIDKSAAGTRTSDQGEGVTGALVKTDEGSSAHFEIVADPQYSYSIALDGSSEELSGPGTAMGITYTQSLNASGNQTADGSADLYVGGTLTVGSGQASGKYEGTVKVTVAYE